MSSGDSPNSSLGHSSKHQGCHEAQDFSQRSSGTQTNPFLAPPYARQRMPARVLRNGKNYAKFVEDALIVRHFRVSDMILRHASGPQHEADFHEGAPHDVEGDVDVTPPPSRSPTSVVSAPPSIPPPQPKPPRAPTCSPAPPLDRETAWKQKKAKQHRQARKVKREAMRELPGGSRAPKAVAEKLFYSPCRYIYWLDGSARRAPLDFEPEAREYALEEALEIPGMTLLDWQGNPSPIVDADHYTFAVLGGHPRDPDWKQTVAEPAASLMQEVAEHIYDRTFHGVYYGTHKQEKAKRAALPNRRGPHRAEAFGRSMGGGQEFPMAFAHTLLYRIVLAGLLAQKPFRRIVGFTNTIFQAFAPDLHAYYRTTMNKLSGWNPQLWLNFPTTTSVFAAVTFNFGPRTVTYPHLDFANLAWGWCAITALGNFDPDKGGHLILWDCKGNLSSAQSAGD
ncbi:hypothetical protein K438DRAFT_1968446 [Mycena galopus ATCC 62051]|nr:hypothetical protein K438DRAFT_1968446 [Mycena galopus ATCC 62051]